MRRDITLIVNQLSSNYPCSDFDFDLMQCYNDIFTYCKTNKKRPSTVKCRINENGFLFVNNVKINKVVYPVKKYNPFSCLPRENQIDYEGLILAKQEKYFD